MPGTRVPEGHADPLIIVLVGFMGAGKTTVGRLLADRLGAAFVDLDREIEDAAGTTVTRLFETEGEAGFRRREAAATAVLVRSLEPAAAAAGGAAVIAVGGGWMARPELRDSIPGGLRVWLDASADTLRRRLGGTEDSRPMLGEGADGKRLDKLLAERLESYRGAELRIATDDRTPDEVVDGILASLSG